MSEQENARMIQELYAAFGRRDVPFILSALAEEVVWQHPRPDDIPWGGNRRGREAVAQFFAAISDHLEVEQFMLEEFVARGDQVVVFGHERMRASHGGRVYDSDWAHVFRLRNGKIAAFREYTDTATIVEALQG
jgi:ketosteroid isomerase-like protein